jgi:GrpB-like predicted nucleotidyltransferase (UPF0157 family)
MASTNEPHLSRPIAVVEYDPRCASLFRAERRLILAVLDDVIIEVEHFGSTSVPGLAAKPIIDMLAGVRSIEEVTALAGVLFDIGYADCGIQVPGGRGSGCGATPVA